MDEAPAPPVSLLDHERLAFAGLALWLRRIDSASSVDESDALYDVARDLLLDAPASAVPYRDVPGTKADADAAVQAFFDRAVHALQDEESVRNAALGVERREARDAIFGALYEIASADVISAAEWPMLEWLAREWGIEMSTPEDPPTATGA